MVIIIPIGIDCNSALILRAMEIRKFALPFDWTVTYQGVADIIRDDFINFIPSDNNKINNISGIEFPHNTFPQDAEKYKRRIERFKDLLKNSQETIVFLKKGHLKDHHHDYNIIENDMNDVEKLNIILKERYPNLKYKINVLLECTQCFDPNMYYTSHFENITVHNTSGDPILNNDRLFDYIHVEIILKNE